MSIDTKKMKALAEKLREDYRNSIKVLPWPYRSAISSTPMEAADAIDLLLAELEAAAADKRDALAFRDLMAAVIREIDHGEYDRPYLRTENAPGHAHDVPGIWDSDNGAKAGTQCAWCATWNAARAALAQRQEKS